MILLNASKVEFVEGESLYDFLRRNNFDPEHVACEVNESLVRRVDFKSFIMEDQYEVEVFSFVGGG